MNRFLWVVRGDTRRLKLAALCQMTLPHPPIVYYGTEVGLSQRRDLQYPDGSRRMEESRTPMPWDDEQDAELLAFYRRLIALRRAHGSLWRSRRVTLAAGDGGLLVWRIAEGAQQALVVFNRGTEVGEYVLPDWTTMLDLATEPLVQIADGRLRLPPMAGALMLGGAPAG